MSGGAKKIAYGGAFSALASSFLIISVFFPFYEYFWFYLAASCVMFPLALGFYFAAFSVYAVSSLLALTVSGFNFVYLMPYILFMGWQPIMCSLLKKAHVPRIIIMAVSAILMDAGLYLLYIATNVFIFDFGWAYKYIYIVIGGLCTPLGMLYAFGMLKQQRRVEDFLKKGQPLFDLWRKK